MEPWTFEPPTEHYDERIAKTDEEICRLLKHRKDLSNNHPGFPTNHYIKKWSEKYAFREEFLNAVFSNFLTEDMHEPVVEPENFQKNIPIMRSYEKDGIFYSVPLIRQFENASVVHLETFRNIAKDTDEWHQFELLHFKLSIQAEGCQFDCRHDEGGGSQISETHTFVVTPALPDDPAEYNLIFSLRKNFFSKDSLFEFII